MDLLSEQARTAVDAFVAANPAYRTASSAADQGATNRTMFGSAGGVPVVFKFFVTAERWRNELFCLQHYADTGVVPRALAAIPDRLLVIERLLGGGLATQWEEFGDDERQMQRLS